MSVQVSSSGIILASGESVGENLLSSIHGTGSNGANYYLGAINSSVYHQFNDGMYTITVNIKDRTLYPNVYYVKSPGTSGTQINLGSSANFHTFQIEESGEYRFWLYANPNTQPQIEEEQVVNFKLEIGSTPTPWTPSLQDVLYIGDHGFFETNTGIARIGESYVEGTEFYEL